MQLPTYESSRTARTHQDRPTFAPGHLAPVKPIPGLYLHIPFCFHRCHYCDFYAVVDAPGPTDRQARFTDALLAELAHHAARLPLRPDSLFVGGGTPTLLRPDHWQRLLTAMTDLGLLAGTPEFTVEANPETVTDHLADILAAGGVNRISIGAQSFDPTHLRTLERHHQPPSVARSIDRFRAAGITRINLDLIFAIPGQSLDQFAADLDTAIELNVEHLSCYGLTYEPNTALTTRLNQGRIHRADEALEAAMYELALDRLAAAGYHHYEISAWARPGATCRHNLLYWRNDSYLGIGPGAASHIDGHRWKNQPHLTRYCDTAPAHPIIDHEQPDTARRDRETLMMGLRLTEGVPTAWLSERFATSADQIARYHRQGLLENHRHRTRLTRRGLLVADGLLAELIG